MAKSRANASARARATRLNSAKHRTETARRPLRIAQAYTLKLHGFTERAIAAQLGCSVSTAHEYVREALAEGMREIRERGRDYVRLELDRLEQPVLALQAGLRRGDTDAIREYRSLSESRRKLLGLDAQRDSGDGAGPSAVSVTFTFAGKAATADIRVAGSVGTAEADGVRPAPDSVDRNRHEDR